MSNAKVRQDQQHPQEKSDREIVNRLLQEKANDYSLVELARLCIRYQGFPGAREIQKDLNLLLQKWQLSKEQLFEKTRQIHAKGDIYRRNYKGEQQDWS